MGRMRHGWLTCPLCGHHFDPASHQACASCPLNRTCSLVCCPSCGYEIVDPGRSRLANWVGRWISPDRGHHHHSRAAATLDELPARHLAQVVGFTPAMPANRLTTLQAYGLSPGSQIQVLQHKPVIIIKIEHSELALEDEIARHVLVVDLEPDF